MLNVVCVLKSGGDFDRRWVDALELSIWDKITEPHRFVCLTDSQDSQLTDRISVRCEPLLQGWPGWWSKIELFRPGLFPDGEPVLFFDLDTVILRDITHLAGAIDTDLVLLRDFYRLQTAWGTGVMGWTAGGLGQIYELFEAAPHFYMHQFRSDQHFIQWLIQGSKAEFPVIGVRFWQDEFPGQLVSYKVHCIDKVPAVAHLVCFHGKPRPHEIQVKWMDEWKFHRPVIT